MTQPHKRLAADVDPKTHRRVRRWSFNSGIDIQAAIIAFFKALLGGDPEAKRIAESARDEENLEEGK